MFDKVNMTITRPGARPTPVSVPRLGLLRARERPDPRLSFFGADFSRFFLPPLTSVRNFFAGAASLRPGRCSHSRAPNFPAEPSRTPKYIRTPKFNVLDDLRLTSDESDFSDFEKTPRATDSDRFRYSLSPR